MRAINTTYAVPCNRLLEYSVIKCLWKGKVYKRMVKVAMMYGSETWTTTKKVKRCQWNEYVEIDVWSDTETQDRPQEHDCMTVMDMKPPRRSKGRPMTRWMDAADKLERKIVDNMRRSRRTTNKLEEKKNSSSLHSCCTSLSLSYSGRIRSDNEGPWTKIILCWIRYEQVTKTQNNLKNRLCKIMTLKTNLLVWRWMERLLLVGA